MPNRILNTNMGIGFQRGRKYDTDLDRLGRMETSHGELRKTRELNLQTEMKKLKKSMNTYSVRRFSSYPYKVIMTESELRTFSEILQREFGMGDVVGGVVNGARDVAGNLVEGTGKVVNSVGKPVAKIAGGVAGGLSGAGVGAALGSFIPIVGTAIGAGLGALAGGTAGSTIAGGATEVVGNTLKNIGQDIHT